MYIWLYQFKDGLHYTGPFRLYKLILKWSIYCISYSTHLNDIIFIGVLLGILLYVLQFRVHISMPEFGHLDGAQSDVNQALYLSLQV